MKKFLMRLMVGILLMEQFLNMSLVSVDADSSSNIVTIGENLSEEQKQNILNFFGVSADSVEIVYVTNADERELLGGHYTEEEIGTRTYSCAYIHLTTSGGIQAKIGNLNRVTSADIAQVLALSGVYNCEVLTAAPFEVSGTGALTGVLMAYEQASEVQLDPVKKDVAVSAIETNEKIADVIGKEEATLVVNDVAIHIIRDNVKEESAVKSTVDEVIQTTETSIAERAQLMSAAPSAALGQEQRETLYDFGRRLTETDYDYDAMKPTLQRVTRNAARNAGIDDPIIETFDSSDLVALPEDSILRGGDDEAMGDIIINSTAETTETHGQEVNLKTDSIELIPAGQKTTEECNAACAYESSEQEYSIEYEGGKSMIVGTDGPTGLEVSEPYRFDDIQGNNILISYDETYEDEETDENEKAGEEAGAESEEKNDDSSDSTGITMPGISVYIPKYEINYKKRIYKYGITDTEGNILVSCAFDEIFLTDYHPYIDGSDQGYGDFGYFPVVYDGTFGYVSSGGDITCLTDIEMDTPYSAGLTMTIGPHSQYDAGCSALHIGEGGTMHLIAADGVITELSSSADIDSIRPVECASGTLWEATVEIIDEGQSFPIYDSFLMDWHGNILLDGYSDYTVSADGKTLYAYAGSAGYNSYEIQYSGNLDGGSPAQGQDMTDQESGTPVSTEGSAKELLEQAAALINDDMAANQEDIVNLLLTAKTELDAANPDAASPVNSAVLLLESGATDAAVLETLISSALGML